MTPETLSSNFYLPPSRFNLVNEIQLLIQQDKLVAIEGPAGIGKTVLLEEALTTALPDANKCYVTASRALSDIQLRSRIIEQLFGNVLFDPEKPLLSSFVEFNQQTQLMVAIDNAHFLSGQIIGEWLQVFSELNKAGIKLAIILAFDKSLSSTLLNINSSLLSIRPISALTRQESYLLMKEYVAELPAETHHKVKRWIDNAKGIPIQLLAYEQDSDLQLANNLSLNIRLWGTVVVVTSVLLALGLYWYRLSLADVTQMDNGVSPDNEQIVTQWLVSSSEGEATPSSTTKPELMVKVLNSAKPEDIFEALSSVNAPTQPPALANNDQKPPYELTDSISEMQPRDDNADGSDSSADSLIPVQAKTKTETKTEIKEKDSLFVAPSEEQEASREQAVDPKVMTGEFEVGPMPDALTPYDIDNSAFFALPVDHYVLQLTAVSSEATLAQYLLSAPVSVDSLRIYKIKRNKVDWIVVTYGLFESIEAARAVAKRVEPNAWAKSVAVIQQQISLYNQSQTK